MVRWLDEEEFATWMAYVQLRQRIEARLASGFAQDGLSAADYELMVALSAAPDDKLRARDLGRAVCWDKTRLSKQLSRMDTRGLVTREPAPEDARGIVVTLTAEGRRLLEKAAPNHVELVRHLFVDKITESEAENLRSLSAKVVAITDAEPEC
jgi:DNA-binding MarR family transcriptional regulator